MRRLPRDHRDDLDTGRAGPDDADAPTAEIDFCMRPCAGEIRLALERVQTLVLRYVSYAEEAVAEMKNRACTLRCSSVPLSCVPIVQTRLASSYVADITRVLNRM